MEDEQLAGLIQRGYSNRYICLLMDVTPDEIEAMREQLSKSMESYHQSLGEGADQHGIV